MKLIGISRNSYYKYKRELNMEMDIAHQKQWVIFMCGINVDVDGIVVDNIFILSYYVVDDNIVVNTFTKDYDCSIIILLLQIRIT